MNPADGTELPTARFAEGPDRPTQVVYELTTPDGTDQITIAWEDDRFALLRSDGRILRSDAGRVVFCAPGPDQGDVCWDFEAQGEPFLQRVAADLLAIYGFVGLIPDTAEQIDGETIAGRDATCVAFSTPVGTGTETPSPSTPDTTYCYDTETEVGLRLDVPSETAQLTLVATSFGEPEAGIFEPTAQVMPYPTEGAPPTAPPTP